MTDRKETFSKSFLNFNKRLDIYLIETIEVESLRPQGLHFQFLVASGTKKFRFTAKSQIDFFNPFEFKTQ